MDKNQESDIYKFWQGKMLFSFDPTTSKKIYSLLMPPPNLTGELHLGHALQHSIMDAVARYKRLSGYEVLLLPGVDHAGIQFEGTLDKKLSKEGKHKKSLGRDKWLEEAWKFKEEIYKSFHDTWTIFGISADWSREVFTLDEGPRQAVFEEFKTFWEKGLIYKGPYIVQWCPKCNTAIEDVEMEYEERSEKLYFVNYKLETLKKKREHEFITVATTRPETIFADVAIAVYPNHPKYSKSVGGKVENPLTGRLMLVLADKRVEKGFGTGALKITPAHDLLDYEIGRDNHLEIISAISKEEKLTEICGKFSGLKVQEAREKVAEKLRALGAIEKEEDYVHNVAVCERCKSVVEPLISEEWFVKMDDLAKEAIKAINRDEINFLPKNYKKILMEWLIDIHDWCISRSLWWGHRIPVWYHISDKGQGKSDKSKGAEIKVSLESPGKGWVQDEQVLDTWFSSGLWPFVALGAPQGKPSSKVLLPINTDMFDKYFPWDFEISAPEIKYLWIARMIMLSVYFTEQIPFKTMFFHGMLRDLEGRKFSKSLGNGIEPQYLIDKWGVDATRMALYTYAIPGRDGRVSKATMDERGKNFRNFGTKIRNIARFVLELKHETRNTKHETRNTDDSWILDELDKTIKKVTKHLDSLELHLAVDALYEFVWHEFADKYIELTKEKRDDAQPTLEHVLKQVLILLHPFMPFLTEELYQKFDVKRESIMQETWPTAT
ncbi:MAG: hypothetical protein UU23_C0002G0032 [Candidatus Curtissbacteria bacterium GW2011_GWA1_40_9]|uniref:Valine--tRNA ligase n=1 Tax=Candidatus Curtissbacteria bacterium GW2011_GWA1_40_9 TaxID=1618408 RepID=A0A0G0W1N1_9BACT|nr:MAG: hypothetical protein UU23_C0002G0032 [Candidatus Curtissbacteria bacterium GW2011_GWA1_40_9]